MSPTPRLALDPRRRSRRRGYVPSRGGWLRVFVLLLALLVAGVQAEATAVPAASVSAEASCGTEHDVLDTALRPPARQGHRTVAPLRPTPTAGPGQPKPYVRPALLVRPSPALRALRTVVLRC